MADNFDMKRFLFENKLGSYARNTVVENQYEGDQYDDEDEDEDEDYDLNAAFWASPASHSYDEVLDIFVSYEDEKILNKFKSYFPEGKDITNRDYLIFSQSISDDMSDGDFIKANWISLTDDDVYEKAGLIENQKEGYMGTQYGSSEDMAVDMIKKGITERYQPGDRWSPNFDYKGMLKAAANLSVSSPEELMQNISDSFEDVNYHRENSHLQDAIEAKKENDNDAIKYHLALFKDELKKTIKNLKETQIFERKKVEEGKAAYEYEKGKAAGEKEAVKEAQKNNEIEWVSSDFSPIEGIKVKKGDKGEIVKYDTGNQYLVKFNKHRFYANDKDFKELKEDIGGDIGDAQAEKMMDFLAEKDKVKEVLSGETLGKMDKSADQLALADFRDNAYYVISSLREDGFDDEDILEFLQQNLTIAFR
jgi:hypothetical protein